MYARSLAVLVYALIVLAACCALPLLAGCAAQAKPPAPAGLPGHPWAYCGAFNDYCASPPKPV